MSNMSSETSADYEASLWQDLLSLVRHINNNLDETGCFQKEEQMYFKSLEKAAEDLYEQSGEDKKAQAKTLIVEILWKLADALLGCG
jgi:predicted transcriptional regulator